MTKRLAHEVIIDRLQAMINRNRALDDETSNIVNTACRRLLGEILREMEIPDKHRKEVFQALVTIQQHAEAEGKLAIANEIVELAWEMNM